MSRANAGGAATAAPPGGLAARLAVHIRRDGKTVVVRVRGGLSGPSVPLFETVVHRLEKRGGACLILDLRGVSVIDAAGAAMVRRSEQRALEAGRRMTVLARGGGEAGAPGPGATAGRPASRARARPTAALSPRTNPGPAPLLSTPTP